MDSGVPARAGWKLTFAGLELHQRDATCAHVFYVTQVVGDTYELDPAASPLRLFAWLAAMVTVARDGDFDAARGMVALHPYRSALEAYTPAE